MTMPKILIILTSNDTLGDNRNCTGFYYEEMAAPYIIFTDGGFSVELASISGGTPPYDPDSLSSAAEERPASVERFLTDQAAMKKLANTIALTQVQPLDYEALLLVGGHGAMVDFPDNPTLVALVNALHARHGIISALCHGTAGLIGAANPDNTPLVKNRHISSFTNEEENYTPKGKMLPFLLENRLRELGAIFESSLPFEPCIVQDGNIVTGQNPASSKGVAETVIQLLKGQSNRHSASAA